MNNTENTNTTTVIEKLVKLGFAASAWSVALFFLNVSASMALHTYYDAQKLPIEVRNLENGTADNEETTE